MPIRVNHKKESDSANSLRWEMDGKVIGQDRAVKTVIKALQKYDVKMHAPSRPILVVLMMGPTGVGKTELVRALSDSILGGRECFTKIDCGEYQHSHEIAKLIGSPPGYIGHKESSGKGSAGRLSQANIDQWSTPKDVMNGQKKPNIILFDEIEKADDSLFDILLGAFDEAKITMGNNETTDLSRSIIFMTSNLGSSESAKMVSGGGIGFHTIADLNDEELDQKIYENAKTISRKFFRIEFLNRIDKLVVFRSLTDEHFRKILLLELTKVQRRLNLAPRYIPFRTTQKAQDFLIKEGISKEFGARELKRTLERYVADPLSNLLATNDIKTGDCVFIDYDGGKELVFEKTWDPINYVSELPPDLVR